MVLKLEMFQQFAACCKLTRNLVPCVAALGGWANVAIVVPNLQPCEALTASLRAH